MLLLVLDALRSSRRAKLQLAQALRDPLQVERAWLEGPDGEDYCRLRLKLRGKEPLTVALDPRSTVCLPSCWRWASPSMTPAPRTCSDMPLTITRIERNFWVPSLTPADLEHLQALGLRGAHIKGSPYKRHLKRPPVRQVAPSAFPAG